MCYGKLLEYQTKENILCISQKIINKFRYINMRIDKKFEIEDILLLNIETKKRKKNIQNIKKKLKFK